MSTLNLGKIRFNWTGAYNNSTAYVANDVVSSGGNSYICILASTGNAVSNATYWSIMSSAGTNGTNGTDLGTVLTTQGDVAYRDGSGLQRLAKGTASQQLAMNSGATAPEWVDPAGGAWAVKSSGSFNDVNNVDFTINSAKAQRIYINGLNTFTQGTTTANSALMGIRTAPTSANTFATGSSDYYDAYWEIINGTTNRGGNHTGDHIRISANSMFGGNSLFNGEVEISIPKPQPETGQRPLVSVRLHSCGNAGNDHWWAYTSGSRQNSENIYSLRFYSHSANIGLKGSYVHTELN